MGSAAAALFLLASVTCLAVVFRESGRIGVALEGLPAAGAGRVRLGRRLYYGCFALAGLGFMGTLLASLGVQIAPAVGAALPVLLAAALVALAAAVAAVVLSWWPIRG